MQLIYHRAISFTLSDLTVDTVDSLNKLFFAVIPGFFMLFAISSTFLCNRSLSSIFCDIPCSAVSWYYFEFVAKKVDVFYSDICYQRFSFEGISANSTP